MQKISLDGHCVGSGAKGSTISVRKGTTKIPGKEDILAQLEAQRVKQAEQLKVEARARQELEDMLLRIERHFKVQKQHLFLYLRQCTVETQRAKQGEWLKVVACPRQELEDMRLMLSDVLITLAFLLCSTGLDKLHKLDVAEVQILLTNSNSKIACDRFFLTAEKHPYCTSWRVLMRLRFVMLDRQFVGVDKFSFRMSLCPEQEV